VSKWSPVTEFKLAKVCLHLAVALMPYLVEYEHHRNGTRWDELSYLLQQKINAGLIHHTVGNRDENEICI
jgi:hypothetical protein